MAKKKKKPAAPPAALNEKAYLSTGRARSLPIYKCLINQDWAESKLAQVLVLRKHVNGHVTAGIYLVDLLCAGVKSTFYYFNIPEHTFDERLATNPLQNEACAYELAHNIIYGGVAFATEYHIDPDPDFRLTQKILEEDTEDIPLLDIDFGRDGKPVLVINPDDTRAGYYLRQLKKHAGFGNYTVVDNTFLDDEDEEDEDEADIYDAQPEQWDEAEWEAFITHTNLSHLNIMVATHLFTKTTPRPLEAAAIMADATALPPVTLSAAALPEFAQSPAEQAELDAVLALLELEEIPAPDLADLPRRLQENIDRWPHNPVFYNYLIEAFELQENQDQADETSRALYAAFPDYLAAKISYANLLLRQNQLDQVPAVFDHHYHLGAVYPNRAAFHITEYAAFYTFLMPYFLEKEDIYTANFFMDQLDAVDIPLDLPIDFRVMMQLNLAIMAEAEKIVLAARENEENKVALLAQLTA